MADEAKRDRYIGGDVFPRSGHSPEAAVVPCLAPRHPRSRSGFDTAQLDRFEALLECPDAELFDWINARALPSPEYDHDVTRLLLTFRYTPRPT
jgi:hypothetical protein